MACHNLTSSLTAPTIISWPRKPFFEMHSNPPVEPHGSGKCVVLHTITHKRPVKESLLAGRCVLTRKIKRYCKCRMESCLWANKIPRSWGLSSTERNIQLFILWWCYIMFIGAVFSTDLVLNQGTKGECKLQLLFHCSFILKYNLKEVIRDIYWSMNAEITLMT